MPPYINVLGSKVDRALVAYLCSVGGDCGTITNITPANSFRPITYPHTTVIARRATPDPTNTGSNWIDVTVQIWFSAVASPKETNYEAARVALDKRVGATADALLLTNDDGQSLKAILPLINAAARALATAVSPNDPNLAANNADMADFTLTAWHDNGWERGKPDESGNAWVENLHFRCLASPYNVD